MRLRLRIIQTGAVVHLASDLGGELERIERKIDEKREYTRYRIHVEAE